MNVTTLSGSAPTWTQPSTGGTVIHQIPTDYGKGRPTVMPGRGRPELTAALGTNTVKVKAHLARELITA
ncbi:hypothetical protein [Amycolatopsis sp. cmx-11-12]|uniref:hypothetical protein n=1 Tax=Amycolatopsis sp. cmx-11-12 TaxID=2785795 RepID=UPI003917CE5F